jgi:hypothetical protein
VFFTSKGKAFARKYNKIQQKITCEYSKLEQQKSAAESVFQQLMNQFTRLSTFAQVAEWDERAELEIHKLIKAIQTIEKEITQHSHFLEKLILESHRLKYKTVLKDMVDKLQEAIDFTPNSSKEQKVLIKELRQEKKELQLQKRELAIDMKAIRTKARSQASNAGRGFLGYNSKLAAFERRKIRYQKEALLRPNEDISAAIERQILQLDKNILWAERFSE